MKGTIMLVNRMIQPHLAAEAEAVGDKLTV